MVSQPPQGKSGKRGQNPSYQNLFQMSSVWGHYQSRLTLTYSPQSKYTLTTPPYSFDAQR